MNVTDELIAATIAELKAGDFYVNARGMTNSKGAAHLLCISVESLDNWHAKGKPVPASYRPSGARGPRYFPVAEVLAFIEERMHGKKYFHATSSDLILPHSDKAA